MMKPLRIATGVTLAALLSQGLHVTAQTGPIREGARRTGEAVADGTRAVVRGSREAFGQTGQATRNAVRTTGDAARAQLNRGERSELQVNAGAAANADANGNLNAAAQAGPAQVQADADLNASQNQLDANGQAYDSNDPNRYESGFRGTDDQNLPSDSNLNQQSQAFQQTGQAEYNGRTYQVRHDSRGREFICVGGCPVYLESQTGNPQSREAYKMNESLQHESMQHSGAHQGQQNSQSIDAEHNTYIEQGRNDSVPAPPAPIRADVQDVNPAGPTLNSDAEASTDANANLNRDSNIGAEVNADAKADSDITTGAAANSNSSARENSDDSQQGSPSPRDEKNEPGKGTESPADSAPNPGT